MRTRSSSNLVGESSSNPTTSNLKRRNYRRSKQPFILEESHVDTMVDQRTMAELLRAPTEGYAEAIVIPPIHAEHFELKHSFINMMNSDQFFGLEKDNPHDHIPDQDSLNSAAGGNLLERRTQDVLTIIKNKSECLIADGNTFLEFWDNIQGYVLAAAVNYNEDNSAYRTSSVDNQIRPPGFAQLNEKNNQNRFSQSQGYNRGNNYNQDTSYQAPMQQNQVVPLRPLPRNIIAYLKGKLKAITTRSGLVLNGPFIPMPHPFINPEEDERIVETLTNPDLTEDPLHPNIPYPLRMNKEKQQEKDEIQIHKFWQMSKQLHINITLADALILLPKYQKMLKVLLSNREKLLELKNTPLNENCSAVILKKLPEKLGDPQKFLILCGFSELKCKALADLGKITRDILVPVRKFTFPADFVIVNYESDPREHTHDYSFPSLYDDYDDDLVEFESDNDDVYDDPFDSKEYRIKESKLLIDKLYPPRLSDFLPSPEYDSILFKDFFEVDALSSTNKEDKEFNSSILIHENLSEVTIQVTPYKNVKKISISNASLILEDFDPPIYELPFKKEVPGSETILSFSFENEEKVFNPRILTSKGVHPSLLLELSHWGHKAFRFIKFFESPMEIFPCSYGEDIRILDVLCLHFYPS
nr:reverse transcriptase domain-containing protein [Tanacetum cinerariifolium]